MCYCDMNFSEEQLQKLAPGYIFENIGFIKARTQLETK